MYNDLLCVKILFILGLNFIVTNEHLHDYANIICL